MLFPGEKTGQVIFQKLQISEGGDILATERGGYLQIGDADACLIGGINFVGFIGVEKEQAAPLDGEGCTADPYLTAALQGKA